MEFIQDNIQSSEIPVGISQLGTVVSDNLVFPAFTYTDNNGNPQSYSDIVLNAVRLSVNDETLLVTSQVQGVDGEIFEYVQTGSKNINIEIVLTPKLISVTSLIGVVAGAVNPISQPIIAAVGANEAATLTEELQNIQRMRNSPEAVPVESKFLNLNFGITNIRITSQEVQSASGDSIIIRMTAKEDKLNDLGFLG